MIEGESTHSKSMKKKDRKSISYLIRMNLNKLASEVKLVLEKAENICTEETLEESNEECKSKSISLERKRKLMIGHLKIIEEIIPKVSALEKEWKEALHSVEIKDEDYEFDLYESYLNSEECLFSSCHKMHYVRTLLTEEIGQINLLCEKEEGNERAEVKSSVRENEGKLTELIEKLVTTSKPPEIKTVEFDGNPKLWGLFITQFEEAIDRREDMTATRKFAHLLGCLKGEALEHISDLAVSEENYALAMKNLKERYGDKQRRIMELYTRLQKLDKSERNVVVLLRELLNILSQLKELGENLETNQLWTTITGKLPDYILGNVIKEKLKKPEWTMQDTITFLKEYIKVKDILEVTKQMQEMEIRKNVRHLSKFSSQNAKFKSNSQGMERMTICATRSKPHYGQSYTNRHEERKKRLPCIFCDGNHWNDECDIYPTVKERLEKLKKLGLCELCMRKDHSQQTCARKLKCFHCGSEHNSALCKKQYEMKQGKDYQIDERVKESPKTVAATMVDDGSRKTYMMCKEVKLINPRETGNTIKALIFFDTGSDCNYVTESIVNKLKLRQTSSNIRMVITGMVGTRKCESRKVTFGVQTLNGNVKNVQAYTVDSILERIPYLVNEKLEKGKWGKPDVLLGVEGIADLIIRNPIKQSTGEIVMETEVGVVTGGTRMVKRGIAEVENNEFHKFKANANITKKESQLRMDQIEQTWKLEVIGIKDLMTEYQEDKALEAFQKSLTVNSEGRCVVGWPWKNQEITPAEGYGLALGRLRSTIRRLKRSPELLECYDEYFKNLLEEGVIEKIKNQNETSRISYLPHQAVVTPQKSTTKLRVVFDASAKTNEGPSLNECLYKGPVMLPLLIGILLRARQGRYLVIADVEKAFLQVSLKQEDRDVTRFLWLKDKSKEAIKENLVIFRFTRVPFGVVSSPFLLAAVIRHLLSEENSELSKEIAENLYVDNVVLTSESEAESTKKAKEAKELFKKIKMQLREFHANHDININNEQEMTDETKVKLLGIEWNTSKDKFIWNWKIPQGGLQTKRQILQFYAAIYDPLGLLSPIILPWKILIQDLWKKGMSWDEKLELEEMRRCSELEKAFNQFNVIEVTRWIPQEYSEIHVFVDASERAVGLAVYARRSSSMTCKPQLIYGKTRLIPKRESRKLSVSIPRLELLAVTLGIRALEFIRQEIEVRKTYLWSDSACALHWLRKPPVGSRYISNRIDEVRRCKGIEFHHVRSTDNPADKASRGLLPEKLKDDLLWWNGPSWLWEQKENWPEDKIMQESVISVCMNMGLLAEEEIQSPEVITLIDVTRFSSLLKLTKTILYVLRFIAKISKDKIKNLKDFSRDNFTYKEYEKTTQLLVRMAQSSITQKEIEHWGLRKDQNGIWRCVGRLRRMMPQIEDFPYFIKKGKLAELIVKYYHENSFHASVHYTWTKMRQRYWIPHGRAYIKKILRKICRGCAMWVVTPFEQPDFPPYPTARITATRPFEITGVDLFGPIIIKENQIKIKRWVALFTCLTTRAVHLEVVETMSKEQCIQAFRRFISRRKQPKHIISDNAKNLIAASKEIIELNRIEGETLEWEFITPGAPWQGGIYERMVGVVKRSLKRAIGTKYLNNAELITLIVELEAIINERPLVDIEEIGLVLRPEDFLHPGSALGERLIGGKDYNRNNATANIGNSQTKELKHQYMTTCKRLDHLWKIWRGEYLEELRKRAQRKHRGPRSRIRREPEIDELVLLKGDCPRNTWKMGRVHKLLRGKDGVCRSAVIRTANGNDLVRAVGHLYPLEISSRENGKEHSPGECR